MSTPHPLHEQEPVPSINPATGEVTGYSAQHTVPQVREALQRAHEAQHSWSALDLAQRVVYLRRVADYLLDHVDEVAEVISRDVGKTRLEALATEIVTSVAGARYYLRNARRMLRPRRLRGGSLLFFNKRNTLHRVPLGVVGIISPWNYPLGIPMHEIVPALLAGNTVVFKTAPETLRVGSTIEETFSQAGLPEGVFTHINLAGEVLAKLFLQPGGVDKLFFTGSVAVGKELMAKAAETLTPVSLELGGNDAMLVCADANLERAVNGSIWAGLQNSGQSCAGVERIYVHQAIYEPFTRLLRERVAELRLGPDSAHDVDVGAMCTQRQVARVHRQVSEALAQGATVLVQVPVPEEHAAGNFLPITVLTDLSHEMEIMREETFGPVLCVMSVHDMDQAVALANDSSLGLTGSVWSRDTRHAVDLGRRIHAGVITVNDHLISHGIAETPWGGFKESGIGRGHGEFVFDEMTEPQAVVEELLPFARRNVFWHPYGAEVYRGLLGALQALYGRGVGKRLRGLLHFARIVPRMFRR